MLTQENLEKIGRLPSENSIMSKFLEDNKRENSSVAAEIESNMAFAMMHYNEESKGPYLFRRISSTSTVKSVYFDSTPSSDSSQQSIGNELRMMIEEKPSKSIYYNILVAGDSGLGKTSFIQTYMYLKFNFLQKFEDSVNVIPTTAEITHNRARRSEGKVDFFIDMIDTPGYGSFRDIQLWVKFISKYLMGQVIKHSKHPDKNDPRVHCCLYFVDSVLKHNDIIAIKEISKYTPIIPIIGKADTCTVEEIKRFKKTIVSQMSEAEIKVPEYDLSSEKDKGSEFRGVLGECPPFCVISAVSRIKMGSKVCYGRKYNWGHCDVNNPVHSDFPLISKYLIGKLYNQVKKISKEKCVEVLEDWNRFQARRKRRHKQVELENKSKKIKQVSRVISGLAFGIFKLFKGN